MSYSEFNSDPNTYSPVRMYDNRNVKAVTWIWWSFMI